MRYTLVGFTAMVALVANTACDTVYHECIDVGRATPLSADEVARALTIVGEVIQEVGFLCEPSEYAFISGSYSLALYSLELCAAPPRPTVAEFTEILLAQSPDHVVTELHVIGGPFEQEFFTATSRAFAERFREEFGDTLVTVQKRCGQGGPRVPLSGSRTRPLGDLDS